MQQHKKNATLTSILEVQMLPPKIGHPHAGLNEKACWGLPPPHTGGAGVGQLSLTMAPCKHSFDAEGAEENSALIAPMETLEGVVGRIPPSGGPTTTHGVSEQTFKNTNSNHDGMKCWETVKTITE